MKQEANPGITIASDFLSPSDSLIFKSISDSLGCNLIIQKMTADQLIGEIRNKRFNSDIDLIMMRSPYDVNRLNRIDIFQTLSSDNIRNRWKDYDVIPLAVDPFVKVQKIDSIQFMDSVLREKTLCLFGEEDLVVYLSFTYQNTDPIVAAGKVRNERNTYSRDPKQPWSFQEIIVPQSKFDTYRKDSTFKMFNWNQHEVLDAYNVITIGVLNQAENYPEALAFIKLLRQEEQLKHLIEQKNLERIEVHNGSMKLLLEDQIQYFKQIERALR